MKTLVLALVVVVMLLLPGCSNNQPASTSPTQTTVTGSPLQQTDVPRIEPTTLPQITVPSAEQLAEKQPIDWTNVTLPAIGESGNWVLSPGMGEIQNAVFSTDGRTIYRIGSNAQTSLRKSTDSGRSWVNMPAYDKLGLCEAFYMKMVNDELFIGSLSYGIFHSADGGNSFNQLPSIIKDPGVVQIDATTDANGKIIVLASISNGLWTLSYPYEKWVDTNISNIPSGGAGYFVWQSSFSPNYAEDRQIIALVGENERLRVTFKSGDKAWGESIADAYIPSDTFCDLKWSQCQFAFPDDYDAEHPVVFVGTSYITEIFSKSEQYADLYRIDGVAAGSVASLATDLDIAGKGTATLVNSLAIRGPASSAIILAGGTGKVYRSTDGGRNWQPAVKPPTGASVLWMDFDPLDDTNSRIYAIATDSGDNYIPRGVAIPVGESSFSLSTDGGMTWNQVSEIDTSVDETLDRAASPNYINDKTAFLITRSHHKLTVSINIGETIQVTRATNATGVTATVYITPDLSNPPTERTLITNGDPNFPRKEWDNGTGPDFILNDMYPSAEIKVIPLTEEEIQNTAAAFAQWWPEYTDPWYSEEWIALTKQPRHVTISVIEGAVEVTKSGVPVVFPPTDSVWKTADGGVTWERILTSGLELLVNGETVKVGSLATIALSADFTHDNTLYVYEYGNNPKVWASTDGGMTFVLCQ